MSKKSMFTTEDGKNLVVTFTLVSSLFLLWGFCNGMIDVMDKHFQEELHLSLSQSAWVQFAHYLGYFLMSLPAGWLATRLGYKGGIIAGLLLVAVGGFWFIPATKIAAFWAFLLGVCLIASGLTFLETIANPYTTVLGPRQFAATRINLAQSCNGIGWIFGPIAGGWFFYSKDAAGKSTGAETLWIPYAGVGVVVIILAVVFFFANVPDIKSKDEYHLDENEPHQDPTESAKQAPRGPVYFLLLGNAMVLIGILSMIAWLILSALKLGASFVSLFSWIPHPSSMPMTPENSALMLVCAFALLATVIAAVVLVQKAKTISNHSIWSHPHFAGATLAQFFYVAAQAGIFSFLINYMTTEPPGLPESWLTPSTQRWLEIGKDGLLRISNQGAANLASLGFIFFLIGRFTGAGLLRKASAHKVLGWYGVANVVACLLVFAKLGWFSVACVFLSYFFMSIMFPTIFALGIHGLGVRAKKASAFLVMAIMGGAILPKIMGAVADHYNMSRGFIVPVFCFIVIAYYGFRWPKLSQTENLTVTSTAGH